MLVVLLLLFAFSIDLNCVHFGPDTKRLEFSCGGIWTHTRFWVSFFGPFRSANQHANLEKTGVLDLATLGRKALLGRANRRNPKQTQASPSKPKQARISTNKPKQSQGNQSKPQQTHAFDLANLELSSSTQAIQSKPKPAQASRNNSRANPSKPKQA